MVAMVEIQIDQVIRVLFLLYLKHKININLCSVLQIPEWLMILFAVSTVLLIAVHMLALMISTCVLPNVEAVANLHFQVS